MLSHTRERLYLCIRTPRLSRCLHHHKPGARGRAGRRPGGGRRRGQQCFLCRGSRAQCEPRQRFLAARQAPSGPQRSWSSTGLFERPKVLRQRMVGARGIEPTMDGLKDRYSAIELYPRVGTRPGIQTPNIFVLSEAPLPVGPAARIGAPGRGRTSNLPVRGRVHGPSCCGRVVVTPEGFEPSAFRLEGGSAVQSAGPELAGHRGFEPLTSRSVAGRSVQSR